MATILDIQLTANSPAASIWFVPNKAIIALSNDFGNYLDTGESFEISSALIGEIGGIIRWFPSDLGMINNREFHIISPVVADVYRILLYPSIDMHLKLEVI